MRAVGVFLALTWVSLGAATGGAGVLPHAPHEIVLAATGAGWKLMDRAGMTLYFYDRDVAPGKSECNQGCAEQWPPLVAAANAKPFGSWSIVPRTDGLRQWAHDGHPLYHYARDAYPGAQFGERPENEAWHVAGIAIPLPPVAAIAAFMGGKVLTTASGAPLYTLDGDRLSRRTLRSDCTAHCLANWRPLAAGLLALPIGDWSVAVREDGTRQWAFRGRALYTFLDDGSRESHGDGMDGVWHRALLEPPPPMPEWVRLQPTDGGIVAADPRGMTLYAYDAEMNVNRPSGGASERGCNQYCLDLYHPVLASPDARTVGDWTPVPAPAGGRQWAYKGLPLSTFSEDRQPGDIVGTKPYRVWHTILPSGIPMQGAGGG